AWPRNSLRSSQLLHDISKLVGVEKGAAKYEHAFGPDEAERRGLLRRLPRASERQAERMIDLRRRIRSRVPCNPFGKVARLVQHKPAVEQGQRLERSDGHRT